MARFLLHGFCKESRRRKVFFLLTVWLAGLACGYALYLNADPSVVSLMRQAVSSQVSITGLANVILIPFLFSAFAAYLGRPFLFLAVAFGKGTAFSFVLLCGMGALGTAGWLFCPLLLFSDFCAVVLLWCYWLRFFCGSSFSFGKTGVYLAFGIAGGWVDYCMISPFLAAL